MIVVSVYLLFVFGVNYFNRIANVVEFYHYLVHFDPLIHCSDLEELTRNFHLWLRYGSEL